MVVFFGNAVPSTMGASRSRYLAGIRFVGGLASSSARGASGSQCRVGRHAHSLNNTKPYRQLPSGSRILRQTASVRSVCPVVGGPEVLLLDGCELSNQGAQAPVTRHAFEFTLAALGERCREPVTMSRTVDDTSTSLGPQRRNARTDMDGHSATSARALRPRA